MRNFHDTRHKPLFPNIIISRNNANYLKEWTLDHAILSENHQLAEGMVVMQLNMLKIVYVHV